MLKKSISILLLVCFLVSFGAITSEAAYPEKPINLVVSWSAGGGSDIFARTIANIVKKYELLSQPIMVVNKPGANGIVGASYVIKARGDSYTLKTFITGEVGAMISAESGISPSDFEPIGMLVWDEYVLVVDKDAPFDTVKEFIDFSKENQGKVIVGGSGIGTVDHMLTSEFVEKSGANLKYISYEGGGEIASAILGGHVTATWTNPAEAQTYLESGNLKALAVASDSRLEGDLNNVPTLREEGYDVVFHQFRGIVGAPGMDEQAKQVLANVIKEVSKKEEFKTYVKNQYMTKDVKLLDDFEKEIHKTEEVARKILN